MYIIGKQKLVGIISLCVDKNMCQFSRPPSGQKPRPAAKIYHYFVCANFCGMSVEELGIKELLPAYLDPDLQIQDLSTGVNFASGGAGFDPLTSELAVRHFSQLKKTHVHIYFYHSTEVESRHGTHVYLRGFFGPCLGRGLYSILYANFAHKSNKDL